jgi:hypothetical protein
MDMFDKKLFSIVFCDDNTPNFKYSNLYIKDDKLPYLTVGNNIPVDTGPFYEKLKAAKPFVALF